MIKNIIANFIGRLWGILSGFLFIPLYIHYLGFESYSIISFTLIISGLMAVLDAGLSATLSREFARTDNSNDEKIRIFRTLESSYFIIVLACIILVVSLSEIIADNWLKLSNITPNIIAYYLKLISIDVGFQLLLRFYMGGLLGLEKQVKANMYQVGLGVLRNGLVIVAILFVPTLEVFFVWQAVSTVIFAILLRFSLCKVLTGYYFHFQLIIELLILKDVWRFAGGMLLISVVAGLNTQMDKIAISKFLPIESLGYYTLSVSLAMGIIVLVNPISVALLPRFTALYSAGKIDEASILFSKINLQVAILAFSVMANMVFFAKNLIWIWTGKMELAEHAHIFLPIIALSFTMLALAMIPYNIAIANGYTKLNNVLGLVSLFVTLPGYWLATKYYGAIGAAYVFCGVQTITTFIYLYFINKKFLKIKKIYLFYMKQILLPPIISFPIAFSFSSIHLWAPQNRILQLTWICFATMATFIAVISILSPKSVKENLLTLLKTK
jgi:O-antigen/teichoic acid export membrane protein